MGCAASSSGADDFAINVVPLELPAIELADIDGFAMTRFTPMQIDALKSSWTTITASVCRDIFIKMFCRHSQVANVFGLDGVPVSDLKEYPRFRNHVSAFASFVTNVIDEAESPEKMIELACRTAARHEHIAEVHPRFNALYFDLLADLTVDEISHAVDRMTPAEVVFERRLVPLVWATLMHDLVNIMKTYLAHKQPQNRRLFGSFVSLQSSHSNMLTIPVEDAVSSYGDISVHRLSR